MTDQLMDVISGASHGSHSFVHDNFIYRINKIANKYVYLSCRVASCKGAGKGLKGASRGEVYNFQLTKPHYHPSEERKIRMYELKQYVRDEASSTRDSSKAIYERAVIQFNFYDLTRACVDGLVKRSRERTNSVAQASTRKRTRSDNVMNKRPRIHLKSIASLVQDVSDDDRAIEPELVAAASTSARFESSDSNSPDTSDTETGESSSCGHDAARPKRDEPKETVDEALLRIFSQSQFTSKENVFRLLEDADSSVAEDDEDPHVFSSTSSLKIIKSASELCDFATVKANQMRNILFGKKAELKELEGLLVEHLGSLMCLTGAEFFQKCFSESLREALDCGRKEDEGGKVHVWNEEEIVLEGWNRRRQLAVALLCYSGRAYRALSELVDLPGPHVARKWGTNASGDPGFSSQAFAAVRGVARRVSTIYVILSMEDVPLRREVYWDDGRLCGLTDLGYGRVESDHVPDASRAVIFHAAALNASWSLPLGYCLVDHLSPQVRSNLLCQYISKLEFSGVKVIGVVLDDSALSYGVYNEFGVFPEGALPLGSFHTNPEEKIRVSPFIDTPQLMRSIKLLLREKETFLTPSGDVIKWSHCALTERIFNTNNWKSVTSELSHYLNCLKTKINKHALPFSRHLLSGMEILKKLNFAEFGDCGPTIQFVSTMVAISEAFECNNRFRDDRPEFANNKETLALLNKWTNYVSSLKFPCGTFARDADRKAPLMNLCTNLRSVKTVVARFGGGYIGLARFSLKSVHTFTSQLRTNRLLTPSQFKKAYFRSICALDLLPSAQFVGTTRYSTERLASALSTFVAKSFHNFSPIDSACDRTRDYFTDKTLNAWTSSVNCPDCFQTIVDSLHRRQTTQYDYLYTTLNSAFRLVDNRLCSMDELPASFTDKQFDSLANWVLNRLTIDGSKIDGHLFNSVEFGDVCHLIRMLKDLFRIYLQIRLVYLPQEVKVLKVILPVEGAPSRNTVMNTADNLATVEIVGESKPSEKATNVRSYTFQMKP